MGNLKVVTFYLSLVRNKKLMNSVKKMNIYVPMITLELVNVARIN